jgi:hypothetical protein
MSSDITGHDRIPVELPNGEEAEVFNHCSVTTRHYVNSVNGHETFEPSVSPGDMRGTDTPDYITQRLARYLQMEWGIDATELGIQVIDISDDEIRRL